ncbi:Lsr2 family protein [Streptomyces sp. NPDC056159]|uniref:histone-like nucleoid-structuring protein Lsr2 n=1 Tax=Streptomyces sp. NPDC056159 TaxID=3155537 RepID=UPI00342551C7
MAQKTVVQYFDDLDGSEATQTVLFGLDGKTFEIDLNDPHAEELRGILAPYVGAARKTSQGRTGLRRIGSTKPAEDTAAIRAWARANGYDVNDRGRISGEIREAYERANAA